MADHKRTIRDNFELTPRNHTAGANTRPKKFGIIRKLTCSDDGSITMCIEGDNYWLSQLHVESELAK